MPVPEPGGYLRYNAEVEDRLPKAQPTSLETTLANLEFQLNAFRWLRQADLPAGARILDYGCGSGAEVSCLVQAGYDAHGVDILEYWGRDKHLHGQALDVDSLDVDQPELAGRLQVMDPSTSLLPFPDDFFDLVVSEQVMEHVFDLEPTFQEQARVLRPGGLGIHRMPSSTSLMEAHTNVPVVALNRYRWYLAAWAIAGRRNQRQHGLTWRDTVASNQSLFGTTHYVPRSRMLEYARRAGLKAHFMRDYFHFSQSRLSRFFRKLQRIGLGSLAAPALLALSSVQILIVEKPE